MYCCLQLTPKDEIRMGSIHPWWKKQTAGIDALEFAKTNGGINGAGGLLRASMDRGWNTGVGYDIDLIFKDFIIRINIPVIASGRCRQS